MCNHNTVSGEAGHSNSYAMQVFNDLHCSNRCRFISIAWSVATASLPLNTVQLLLLEIHACNNPSPVFKRCLLSAVASTSSQGVCEVR